MCILESPFIVEASHFETPIAFNLKFFITSLTNILHTNSFSFLKLKRVKCMINT